jgi:hypothetical protein
MALLDDAAPQSQARRAVERRSCRVEAHLDARMELPDGRQFDGVALDVSVGGMFVLCDEAVDIGTPMRITLWIPEDPRPLELTATVRWTKRGGFGLQLGLLGARETHALVKMIGPSRTSGPPSSSRDLPAVGNARKR